MAYIKGPHVIYTNLANLYINNKVTFSSQIF